MSARFKVLARNGNGIVHAPGRRQSYSPHPERPKDLSAINERKSKNRARRLARRKHR